MSISVDAVYEDGSFKPTQRLPLTEHERVRLTVVPVPPSSTSRDQELILTHLTALTRQLFGSDVKVVQKSDPEIPGEHYFAFYATSTSSEAEIMLKEDAWHRDLLTVAPEHTGQFRLAVFLR